MRPKKELPLEVKKSTLVSMTLEQELAEMQDIIQRFNAMRGTCQRYMLGRMNKSIEFPEK